MSKVHKLYNRLQAHKRLNPVMAEGFDSYYDQGRHTYCHLILMEEVKGLRYAKFEVRGWGKPTYLGSPNNGPVELEVSAVNWTITAGTCVIKITEENIDNWEILEDNKTLQVLIGNR